MTGHLREKYVLFERGLTTAAARSCPLRIFPARPKKGDLTQRLSWVMLKVAPTAEPAAKCHSYDTGGMHPKCGAGWLWHGPFLDQPPAMQPP